VGMDLPGFSFNPILHSSEARKNGLGSDRSPSLSMMDLRRIEAL
jgi:hypothetical protein